MFHRLIHSVLTVIERRKNRHIVFTQLYLFTGVFVGLLAPLFSVAQTHIIFVNDTLNQVINNDTTSTKELKLIEEKSLELQLQGYLGCVLDSSVRFTEDSVHHYFNTGIKFKLNELQTEDETFKMTGVASQKAIENYLQELLIPLENNGYPFASIELSTSLVTDSLINIEASVKNGPLVLIDSLVIRSEKKFHQIYLEQYLAVSDGEPYSEKNFRAISKRIQELPFAEMIQPPQVLFTEEGAQIFVYLKERKANRFDGIIGFQPDNETGNVVFTGDVSLALQNVLRRGESISLNWRRLQESTQDLSLKGALPYLFNTKLGTWAGIDIYRRDSTFTTTELELSFGLVNGANRNLRAFYQLWSSNALTESITSIENVRIDRYGIGLIQYSLNQLNNPSRGAFIELTSSIGRKETAGEEEDDPSLISEQYAGELSMSYWLPLAQRVSLGFVSKAGFKADNAIRFNELYRIGGLGSIRGFDEESIFAQNFAIGTAELKYLLDSSSAVFLFYDQAWYERSDEVYFKDAPFGFGAGALIGTSSGSFRISYGLGSEQNNPILLRNGKVHFGYINSF